VGEHVELELDFDAYEQKPGVQNRNFVRFRDGLLVALGRTGVGTPFMRDHDQDNVLARGGAIIASATEKRGEGDYLIRQTARLTAPWAVELALRGLLTSVSIGWNATGEMHCSICRADFYRCAHMPGERYAMKSDDDGVQRPVRDPNGPLVAELVYTEAELVETSAVSVPAVPSAQIRRIRSPLEVEAERIRSPLEAATRPKEIEMSKFTNLSATPVLDRAIAETLARSGEADLRARLRAAGVSDDAITAMFYGACRSAAHPAAPSYAPPPPSHTQRHETSVDSAIAACGGDAATVRAMLARDAKLTPEAIEKQLAAMVRPAPSVVVRGARSHSRGATLATPASALDAQIDADIRAEGGDPTKVRRDLARGGLSPEDITKQLASMCGR
jgi:hypothetical protein